LQSNFTLGEEGKFLKEEKKLLELLKDFDQDVSNEETEG